MKKYIGYLAVYTGLLFNSGCSKDALLSGNLSSKLTVTTLTISGIGQNSANGGVQVSGGFSEDVADKGICVSLRSNPTTNDKKYSGAAGSGIANSVILELTPATTYFVRGYLVTRYETLYGEQKQFTTVGYQLPTLTTITPANITMTTAVSGGNVTASGGGTVTAKGVCWGATVNPTTADNRTTDGAGLGTFTSNLTNLSAGMQYYVRAYAVNQAGTSYGSQVTFNTIGITLATLSGPAISGVTQSNAVATSSVASAGGGIVTTRGICWGILPLPTTSISRTIDGAGIGPYTSVLSGLTAGTTYYVRAYAINQAGTAYSAQSIFTTTAVQTATVGAPTISGITRTTAVFTANISSDGGGAVTSRGVCYSSTTTAPTLSAAAFTTNGTGIGVTSGTLSGLTSGTIYYVRAYAVNAAGTAYGSLNSFKTL